MRPGAEITLRVDRLDPGGRGIGRWDGHEVFIDDVVPGEIVHARLTRVARTDAEAIVLRIDEPSGHRAIPRCPHFGTCGGCRWQHVAYGDQASAKEAFVLNSVQQLGGPPPVVRPIIASEDPWQFRNKMEFSFQPPDRLGLHRRGRWDDVVDVHTCFLPSPRTVTVLQAMRTFMRAQGLACYDTRLHQGFLRHLVVREGQATGELLVALVTAPGAFPQAPALVEMLCAQVPGITSVLWAINASKSDAVEVTRIEVLRGRPFIYERLGGLTFKVGLLTFFQTNTKQAERLIRVVREFAQLQGPEYVIDLYCGVGTFALAVAPQANLVMGLDRVPAAIEAARENAQLNGIANVSFHAAAASEVDWVLDAGRRPDVVILDPPRAGAGAVVMRRLAYLAPRSIVYVSCNPATLVPDLRDLKDAGYVPSAVQPIDLFPHTPHVECVVQLERSAGH